MNTTTTTQSRWIEPPAALKRVVDAWFYWKSIFNSVRAAWANRRADGEEIIVQVREE